ncbi:MAG: hypothetical protein KBD83_06445 [Gammaproteobacteria bacterium]|nr:hypothetical protein [Gammaproteobacteria bacterium]
MIISKTPSNYKRLFITAPSRSGSSLFTNILNSLPQIKIANEPFLNGVPIWHLDAVNDTYSRLEAEVGTGQIMQRLENGDEPTDTYPNNKLKWGPVYCDPNIVTTIGIKVSFPAFSRQYSFKKFIATWKDFITWMEEINGSVICLIRNPIYTIMSWKSTFSPLFGSIEHQCLAWNEIVDCFLSIRNNINVIRYEDFTDNFNICLTDLLLRLGFKDISPPPVPAIKVTNSLEYYHRIRNLNAEKIFGDIEIIKKLCSKHAYVLGYSLESEMPS